MAVRVNACMAAGHTEGGKVERAGISEGAVGESRLVTQPGKEIQAREVQPQNHFFQNFLVFGSKHHHTSAEADSLWVALQASPSAVNNAAFCVSAVGLVNKGVLEEMIDRHPKRRT